MIDLNIKVTIHQPNSDERSIALKITTKKIAELAGVSRGAVDKTIHNRPGVREDVRKRILQVIEETGYVPLAERKVLKEKNVSKTVAVILPRLTNPYFAVLKRYMDKLSSFMEDLTLEYYPCNTTDIPGILSTLEMLKARNIDGYLFRGVRSKQVKKKLDEIGKPVIFFDSDVPKANRLCFIGEDCTKSGRLAASLLAKSIGYQGQVAVVTGSMDIPSHQQRANGFLDVIYTEYPNIHVVQKLYSNELPAVAYQQAGQLLDDYPKLKGICNLAGCSGEIGQAILERRINGAVRLVCFSTAGDVIALIRKSIVTFSISLLPHEQARLLLETMYGYLKYDKKPSSDFITTPVSIALDENMDSLIKDFGDIV